MYKIIELEIDPELSGDTGVFEVAWVEYPAIEQEMLYFNEQKFYKAPQEVADRACKAIEENEKRGNKAATQVGKVRAQQLCSRSDISLETVKRMKSYLERAATYNSGDWDDNGTISYNLWGGVPALKWVDSILRDVEKSEEDFVKPQIDENKDEFISRCIPYLIDEGKTQEQAAGACYGMWDGREFAKVGERGGITESNKAPKSSTPNRNPQGEGTAKGKATDTRSAEVSERVEDILKGKADDFNERYKDKLGYGVNVGMLKSVYQRGVGAYNTSHSPAVKSAEQWALARVNAFLYLVRNGRQENPKYKNDFDLLPSEHPKKEKFAPTRVSFEWDVLKTREGLRLFNNELSSGSIPVIFVNGIPSKDLIDFTLEYGMPATSINMYRTLNEKIELIKDMGVRRHYDLDMNTRKELGTVAVNFDYDVTGLPEYVNYPEDEEEDDMLVKPKLPPVLFSEECGCGNVDMDFSSWDEEDLELKKYFDFLYETSPETFEAVTNQLLRGYTLAEIKNLNHKNPTKYYLYKRVVSGSPDRDFCMSLEGRYFRRGQIYGLENYNRQFGHNGGGYSKWLYKGGPQCVHAWEEYSAIRDRIESRGMVNGTPGIAPQQMEGAGYYPGTPRYEANLSKQSVGYLEDIECAFGDLCKIDFNKETEQMFAAKDEERMIYTPLMIPNMLIPRYDEVSKEKYFVKFTPQTIQNIRDKFMIELRNRKTNLEHTDEKFEDIVMVESWIVQGDKDKAYELGFTKEQIPFGTWMGAYKVLDTPQGDYVWNEYVKPGKVRGASVEGNFILNFSVQKGDEYLLEQIINILNKITD